MPHSPLRRMFVVSAGDNGNQVIGVLDLEDGSVTADDGATWLVDNFVAALPSRSGPRQVFPSEGEAFLLACWFSLRGTYVWGELEARDGLHVSRDDALTLVDTYASLGEPSAGITSEDVVAGDALE